MKKGLKGKAKNSIFERVSKYFIKDDLKEVMKTPVLDRVFNMLLKTALLLAIALFVVGKIDENKEKDIRKTKEEMEKTKATHILLMESLERKYEDERYSEEDIKNSISVSKLNNKINNMTSYQIESLRGTIIYDTGIIKDVYSSPNSNMAAVVEVYQGDEDNVILFEVSSEKGEKLKKNQNIQFIGKLKKVEFSKQKLIVLTDIKLE